MAGAIPQNITEEISLRLNPVDVIGEYVQLRRSGSKYLGLCPFHDEKTPSMNVDPDSGLWYCFGCQAGGNLFQFVQRMENLSYFEAVRLLAEKAGVAFELSETAQRDNSERLRALNLLERAADYYHAMLLENPDGQLGREYMISRNIARDTAVKFRLGYSPDNSTLLNTLLKAGFKTEEILKCGLIRDNSYYGPSDIMRGRLIYPICDAQGRVVAFGGRRLDDSKKEIAKYMNTPETPWYSKRHTLYGLNWAKNDIKKQHVCVLVEGYFDVISLHQVGVTTAVASCGTAFTQEQAQLLKRFSVSERDSAEAFNVFLMYDSDAAGEKATLSANEIIEEAGLRAQAVFLPFGDDPDSLAQRGLEEVQKALNEAEGIVSYKMRKLLASEAIDLTTPEGQADFVSQIMPLLRQVKDPVRRDAYLRRLSFYSGSSETRLYSMLRSFNRAGTNVRQRIRRFTAEEELFTICVSQPRWISMAREIVTVDMLDYMLEDEQLRTYFYALFTLPNLEERTEAVSLSELLTAEPDAEESKRLAELLTRDKMASDAEDVRKLALAVRDRMWRRRLDTLRLEIVPALDAGNIDNRDSRYQEYTQLKRYFHGETDEDNMRRITASLRDHVWRSRWAALRRGMAAEQPEKISVNISASRYEEYLQILDNCS